MGGRGLRATTPTTVAAASPFAIGWPSGPTAAPISAGFMLFLASGPA